MDISTGQHQSSQGVRGSTGAAASSVPGTAMDISAGQHQSSQGVRGSIAQHNRIWPIERQNDLNRDVFTLKKRTRLDLDAHKRVGLGRQGLVVVATTSELHKYLLKEDGSYASQWSKPLSSFNLTFTNSGETPVLATFSDSCYKRVLDNGQILLQQDENGVTVRFNGNMELRECWEHEGHLIGNLPSFSNDIPERPVYKVTHVDDSGRRDLQIMNGLGDDLRLRLIHPEGRYKWRGYLSICESVKANRIVVLGQHYRTLDFFDRDGRYQERVELHYEGIEENGICCTEDNIFVAGNYQDSLHVYDWSGDHIGFCEKKNLGLYEKEKICAIQYNPGDKVLQMAVSDYQGKVHSLSSYSIGSLPPPTATETAGDPGLSEMPEDPNEHGSMAVESMHCG